MKKSFVGLVLAASAIALPTFAQQPDAAPIGATPAAPTSDKAALDQSECKNSASQATGYVPGAAPMPTATAAAPSGARVRGAATGAATGAVVGSIQENNHPYSRDDHVGNNAAMGAAAGMVAGGHKQRKGKRDAAHAQEAATQAQANSATAWQNSYQACLTQRGSPPAQ